MRTLIVDDNLLARHAIRDLLTVENDIEIIGECGSGREAIDLIRERCPDLLLLDVHLPDMDAFAVVRDVGCDKIPVTIFVTAFDKYAIEAFNIHAVDYILKPIEARRFTLAVGRARSQVRSRDFTEQLFSLLANQHSVSSLVRRIGVKSKGKVILIRVNDIDWIQAEGNNVRIHCGTEQYVHREAIGSLGERLDHKEFVRIHRSTIVNIDRVREIRPWPTGEYVVMLTTGKELTLSRGFKKSLQALTGETNISTDEGSRTPRTGLFDSSELP